MVPNREEKLQQLDKILQSRALHGAESLRAFLRFVVQESIDNHAGHLKEYTIATQVFGRGGDYDPRIDSVVRVQAGRLRTKLQKFYATEGRHDRVMIDLPKGQYSPVFTYTGNGNSTEAGTDASAPATMTSVLALAHVSSMRLWQRLLLPVLACACLGLAVTAFTFYSEAKRLRALTAIAPVAETTDMRVFQPLWGDFFRSPDPILVSYSNTVFEGSPDGGMRLFKPLASTPDMDLPKIQSREARSNSEQVIDYYTGVGEVTSVYSLVNLFSRAGRSFRVKRSLLMTWDDFKTENVIMLGSTAENFILRELPQKQDFTFRMVPFERGGARFGIINLRPRPGEERQFFTKPDGSFTSKTTEDYAVISLLRGLDENHRLLILAGMTTFGTQAATEYVTKPEYIQQLTARLNTGSREAPVFPRYYQVIVRVKINDGVPVEISYVTHHVLS